MKTFVTKVSGQWQPEAQPQVTPATTKTLKKVAVTQCNHRPPPPKELDEPLHVKTFVAHFCQAGGSVVLSVDIVVSTWTALVKFL